MSSAKHPETECAANCRCVNAKRKLSQQGKCRCCVASGSNCRLLPHGAPAANYLSACLACGRLCRRVPTAAHMQGDASYECVAALLTGRSCLISPTCRCRRTLFAHHSWSHQPPCFLPTMCCVSQGFVALEPELVNVTVMAPSAAAPAGAQLPLPAGSAQQPAHTGMECEFHCLVTAGVDSVVCH